MDNIVGFPTLLLLTEDVYVCKPDQAFAIVM